MSLLIYRLEESRVHSERNEQRLRQNEEETELKGGGRRHIRCASAASRAAGASSSDSFRSSGNCSGGTGSGSFTELPVAEDEVFVLAIVSIQRALGVAVDALTTVRAPSAKVVSDTILAVVEVRAQGVVAAGAGRCPFCAVRFETTRANGSTRLASGSGNAVTATLADGTRRTIAIVSVAWINDGNIVEQRASTANQAWQKRQENENNSRFHSSDS